MDPTQLKVKLFRNAEKGNWDEVVNMYNESAAAHTMRMNSTGKTALHLAVLEETADVVEKLLKAIKKFETIDALKIHDESGNGPLHAAASLGDFETCEGIAVIDYTLIGDRNKDDQTPLFLAALNGRRLAFICLQALCGKEQSKQYYKMKNEVSILHVALLEEEFELASLIIELHPELVHSVDKDGISPLHILANKPSVFKSTGSPDRWLDKIIYHSTWGDDPVHGTRSCLKIYQNYISVNEQAIQQPVNGHRITLKKLLWEVLFPSNIEATEIQKHDRSIRPKSESQIEKGDVEEHKDQPNPGVCLKSLKTVLQSILLIKLYLGRGINHRSIRKIENMWSKKGKHTWSEHVLDKLLKHLCSHDYEHCYEKDDGISSPPKDSSQEGNTSGSVNVPIASAPTQQREKEKDTPILIGAKNGIVEIVEKILDKMPEKIDDLDSDKKNIVLLAIENKQLNLYQWLLSAQKRIKSTIFQQVDKDGNNILHLAAKQGNNRPWLLPSATLQMHWELKWFEFVEESMSNYYLPTYNKKRETAEQIFAETHRGLAKEGASWLQKTSESCSVVATLLTTVSFATTAAIPGGFNDTEGTPILGKETAFKAFAVASLFALCLSMTSTITFLSIMIDRKDVDDFRMRLPRKLLLALTTLFGSIGAMMTSFCSSHYFAVRGTMRQTTLVLYAVLCLPVMLLTFAQFPFYYHLLSSTFAKKPRVVFKATPY